MTEPLSADDEQMLENVASLCDQIERPMFVRKMAMGRMATTTVDNPQYSAAHKRYLKACREINEIVWEWPS